MRRRFVNTTGFSIHEILLMVIMGVVGILIGVIPAIRIHRHSLADGLTVRVG